MASKSIIIKGRSVWPGVAKGHALIGEAIQGNGALDYDTGEIIQKGHALKGKFLKGCVLIIAGARGSTAWSVRLHTTTVNNVGPTAMVFPRMDCRTASAATEMKLPCVTDLETDPYSVIDVGDMVIVDGDKGLVEVIKES